MKNANKKYYWMADVEKLAGELMGKGGKLDSCFGQNRRSVYRSVAALRIAGLQEGADSFECNYCGKGFLIKGQEERHPSPVAVIRGDVPCVMCSDCAIKFPAV